MSRLSQEFNINDLPEGSSFEPLPAGWYTTTIAAAELKNTKSGSGKYISVRYDVTGPTHQGRVVFGNLNIQNQSSKAEEIGRQQLGELMRAIGLARVVDTDQLIGGNCEIKLIVKHDDQYGDGNEIKGWRAIGGSAKSTSKTDAPENAKAGSAPPWATKK